MTQCCSLIVALGLNWEGVSKTLMLINDRVAHKNIKMYNIGVTDVVFKVEYLCNGWVKKDGVNANLV